MRIRLQLCRLLPLALVPVFLAVAGCRTLGSRGLPETIEVAARVTNIHRSEGGPHLYVGEVTLKAPLRYRGAKMKLEVVSFDRDLGDLDKQEIRTSYSRDELQAMIHPIPDIHGTWPLFPTLDLEYRSGSFVPWDPDSHQDLVEVTASIRQVMAEEPGQLFLFGGLTAESGDSVIVEILSPEKFRGTRFGVFLSGASARDDRWRQLRGRLSFKASAAKLARGSIGWFPADGLTDVTFDPSPGE